MSHQIEHEYKLTATSADVLDHVRRSPLVRQHLVTDSEVPVRRFMGRYYDTHDLTLHQLKWSFRARREGPDWRAALKTGTAMQNGHLQCQEYQAEISGWLDSASPLPEGPLREKLLSEIEHDAQLHERVRVDMQRHQCELDIEGIHVEMVTDRGTISANGSSIELFEVEIEQRYGDLEAIQHFVDALLAQFDLRESTHSKHQLGLSLYA